MAAKSVSVVCEKFKDHKRVTRFKENEKTSVVGSVYVDKDTLKELGNPESIKVTITPA